MGDNEAIPGQGLLVSEPSRFGWRQAREAQQWRVCAILCCAVLLVMGCAPTWDRPISHLEPQGTALYELPFGQELPTGIRPGRYTVTLDVIYTATQEEATRRCNFGLPGGDSLACYLQTNNIIIAPVPRNANDWTSMCYLGHEVTHATHGAWHP